MTISDTLAHRQALRRYLRAARNNLQGFDRLFRQQRILTHLTQSIAWQASRHVALYLPHDGEVDLRSLLKQARKGSRKTFYLPCLQPDKSLLFAPWQPGRPLRPNRFGIGEPVTYTRRKAVALDLILMPLVGFDAAGNRLGMGGGFYDRTLKHIRHRPGPPLLVGVAFEIQRCPALPHADWDVPLDRILTERGLQIPRPNVGYEDDTWLIG